jgi:hypothetical protein
MFIKRNLFLFKNELETDFRKISKMFDDIKSNGHILDEKWTDCSSRNSKCVKKFGSYTRYELQ